MLLSAGQGLLLAQTTPSTGAAAPAATGSVELAKVISANQLTAEGKHSFDLKFSYQVFTLSGDPGEKGNVRLQWASTKAHNLEVTSPALGTLHSLSLESSRPDPELREIYLVELLLNAVLHPGATLFNSKDTVAAADRKVGGVVLSCLQAGHTEIASATLLHASLCVDSQSDVRLITEPNTVVVRNSPAKFAGTPLGLDVEINLSGRIAVRGHVDALTGLDPSIASTLSQSEGAEKLDDTAQNNVNKVAMPSAVQAGHMLKRVPPTYPLAARERRISGAVLLAGQITESGTVSQLVTIASPDPSLTEAAEAAVKQWTYTPYLLNGIPTKVNTQMTVYFNLNTTPIGR